MPPALKNPHGRYSTYTNKACRCELCSAAARNYERERNQQPGGRKVLRSRVQRDPRAPLDREHLSELTLAEMDAHGMEIVTCSLCMRVMIREAGAERCRMRAACRERQKKNGWYQPDLFDTADGAKVDDSRRKVVARCKRVNDAIEEVASP